MFRKLRGKLKQMDIDQKYLAKFFDLSQASISHRLTNQCSWTLTEMYAVMDLIRAPHEKLHEYFPKDGKDTASIPSTDKTTLEKRYRGELIELALRILLELDGKQYGNK